MASALDNCSTASKRDDRSSDRCPALRHKKKAFSMKPRLGAVARWTQFGLALSNLGELTF